MFRQFQRFLASPPAAAAVAIVIAGGIAAYLVHLENEAFKARQASRVTARLAAARSDIEREINLDLTSLYAFEALILANPKVDDAEFQRVSAALSRHLPVIREIQLSPDAVVRHVYPAADAPKVVGMDLRTLPGQKQVVEQTIRDGSVRIAGPTQLVQGGTGLIARNPVFTVQGGKRHFWGFVTVLLDYPAFVRSVPGLADDPDVELALRGKDGLGPQGAVFFGRPELFGESPMLAQVTLPDGSWQIAAQPRGGWRNSPIFAGWSRLLVLLFVLGIGALTYLARARGNTIQRIALYDTLTGVLRRHAFLQAATEEIRRALRYRRPLSVLVFDLDHFKQVNDRWGHGGGDVVLAAVARRVKLTLRPSDSAARTGGEEFAVLCPESGLEQARVLAERLRQAVANDPVRLGKDRVLVTVSVGVAEFQGEGDSLQAMMTAADEALYRAKAKGRNRVEAAPHPG